MLGSAPSRQEEIYAMSRRPDSGSRRRRHRYTTGQTVGGETNLETRGGARSGDSLQTGERVIRRAGRRQAGNPIGLAGRRAAEGFGRPVGASAVEWYQRGYVKRLQVCQKRR